MEMGMKHLVLTLAGSIWLYQGFTWLYQGYNYPYYYSAPPVAAAPYYLPYAYRGVDRDFYSLSNESSWDRSWRRELDGWR